LQKSEGVPRPISDEALALQRRIDELHLEHPYAGARMPRDMLKQEIIEVGRKHVATLMRRLGIEALVRNPPAGEPRATRSTRTC
jgi:putative transposase